MSNLRSSKLFHNFILLFATVAVGLIIMDLGFRLVESAKGATHTMRIFKDNGKSPCDVIPNLHLTATIGSEDIVIETNNMGMRWRDVDRTRSSLGPRIAFVGDSFTFGEWSPTTETSFVGIVDSHLRPLDIDVLNFGVPGDGPIEQEHRLVTDILSFEPDYVVLNIYNGNDLSDTLLGLNKTDCETGNVRKDLVQNKVPGQYLETPFQVFRRWLDRHSSLYHALRIAKGKLTDDIRRARVGDQEENGQASLTVEDRFFEAAFWSRTDYPQVATEAKDEMIATLGRIYDLSLAHDFKFILIAIPFREQVYTDAFTGEGYDLALPQRYVAELAAERGIPFYDLLPDFRRYVNDCRLTAYVRVDPHFNGTGHRLAGELITSFLLNELEFEEAVPPALTCDLER